MDRQAVWRWAGAVSWLTCGMRTGYLRLRKVCLLRRFYRLLSSA